MTLTDFLTDECPWIFLVGFAGQEDSLGFDQVVLTPGIPYLHFVDGTRWDGNVEWLERGEGTLYYKDTGSPWGYDTTSYPMRETLQKEEAPQEIPVTLIEKPQLPFDYGVVEDLIESGHTISAIKYVRTEWGCSLFTAHNCIEYVKQKMGKRTVPSSILIVKGEDGKMYWVVPEITVAGNTVTFGIRRIAPISEE